MPSSDRIIRGAQADEFQQWSVKLLGEAFEGPVDRLLTQISRDRPGLPDLQAKIIPSSPAEEQLSLREQALLARELQLNELEDQARQQGFAQGREQGYEAGWVEAAQERHALSELTTQMAAEFEALKRTLADKVVQLSVMVAKKVLADSLHAHPEHAAVLVQELVEQLALDPQSLTVKANPATLTQLRNHLRDDPAFGALKWSSDPNQLPGGVVLSHPEGAVDASLSTRWGRIMETLGQQEALTAEDLNKATHPPSEQGKPDHG